MRLGTLARGGHVLTIILATVAVTLNTVTVYQSGGDALTVLVAVLATLFAVSSGLSLVRGDAEVSER